MEIDRCSQIILIILICGRCFGPWIDLRGRVILLPFCFLYKTMFKYNLHIFSPLWESLFFTILSSPGPYLWEEQQKWFCTQTGFCLKDNCPDLISVSSRARMIGVKATQIIMPFSHLNWVQWASPFLCFKSLIKLQADTILGQNILLQEVCKYDISHLLQ